MTNNSRFNQQQPAPRKVTNAYHAPTLKKWKPTIDPATLNAGQRRKIWEGIKTDNPALAEMLTNDPTIAALKTLFDAKVIFEIEEVEKYL